MNSYYKINYKIRFTNLPYTYFIKANEKTVKVIRYTYCIIQCSLLISFLVYLTLINIIYTYPTQFLYLVKHIY